MITLRNRIAGLVGLMMLTGTAAFAQSEMKLDVPFTFHTTNATMSPGTYTIALVPQMSPTPVYRIRNAETRKTVLVTATTRVNREAGDKKLGAKVEFQCAGEYCAIAKIYDNLQPTGQALNVRLANGPRGEKVASVMVPAR